MGRRLSPFIAALLVAQTASAEPVPLDVPLTSRGYELIVDEDGVAVYQSKTSAIIDLGADAVFNASPEHVARVLLDYPRQVGRIGRLSEAKVLACSPGRMRVYQRLNLPVVDDRDFNLEVTWGREGESTWISYWAVPDGVPPQKGVVRLSHHQGSWQLRPLDGGKATQVRFMVSVDMDGLLPRWMVRWHAAKEVPALFRQIERLLAEPDGRRSSCPR